ncbi:hypothetical protein EHS25_001039 [Saitozyma podzolica]|uniref:PrpF protein n=1 Tax=Saitozyma podzolica TaxID=1890683 RepID=A0A427YHM1_9TREE|nr:hypothetical protein EHS25_001039 [Saitozyma podzolica]
MNEYTPPLTPPHPDSPSPPSSDLGSPVECQTRSTRRRIRSVLMRAGTSRGLFFRLEDLPVERAEWREVILGAMGSPDPYLRQLDGLGGGQSTSSKVAVVSRSTFPGVDIDYLFIQVPVDGNELDFSGNCGNMASGVGPFAVDEGLVNVKTGLKYETTVRIRNVNTNRIIHSTFLVKDGMPVEDGNMHLDGVSSPGSPIKLDFVDPSGSMTGKLLPTGTPLEQIQIGPAGGERVFSISCVDAANPFVFVLASELGLTGSETVGQLAAEVTSTLLEIRARAAVRMGLAKSHDQAVLVGGTPKIAIVGPPCDYVTSSGRNVAESEVDVWVRPFSMGRPHPSIQMTGAVCVGAASSIPGSMVNLIVRASQIAKGKMQRDAVVIGHASGKMATQGDAEVTPQGEVVVRSGSVYRTARRLMEGTVLYLAKNRSSHIRDVEL